MKKSLWFGMMLLGGYSERTDDFRQSLSLNNMGCSNRWVKVL